MGCDIHMYAETRNEDGTWTMVGDVFTNPWYHEDSELSDWNKPKHEHPYDSRNYTLFAILADVRNGYGFAGIYTHEPVRPLFAGRGVPSDASSNYREIVEDWNYDGHSHAYATLAELQAVDWSSIVIDRGGYLTAQEYNRMLRDGDTPRTWCGNVGGGGVVKVTAAAYEANYRKAVATIDDPISVYVQWFWQENLADVLGEFLETTMPELSELGNPEDVRIVFFFDN